MRHGYGWWMVIDGLLWLAVLAFLAYLAVTLSERRRGEDPLEITERRYARGEIDRDEFERLRADLLPGRSVARGMSALRRSVPGSGPLA